MSALAGATTHLIASMTPVVCWMNIQWGTKPRWPERWYSTVAFWTHVADRWPRGWPHTSDHVRCLVMQTKTSTSTVVQSTTLVVGRPRSILIRWTDISGTASLETTSSHTAELARAGGHYSVQDHWTKSLILVPTESIYANSY